MNKEAFLKELNRHLGKLTDEAKKEELKNYNNLKNYDLNPVEEANKIYQKRGLKYTVNKNIKLLDAASILIDELRSNNKEKTINVILFFLYLIILLILIKIPFIYVRDIIASLFNPVFINNNYYTLWNLLFEILYAITTIIVFINLIKNKALDLEKNEQ